MLEKKNIDRVFQENFKDLEIQPKGKIWSNIENQLNQANGKKVVPLWQQLSGVAMILLFLSSVSVWYFNNSTNNIPPIVPASNADIPNGLVQDQSPTKEVNSPNHLKVIHKTDQQLVDLTKTIAKSVKKSKPVFIEAPSETNSFDTTLNLENQFENHTPNESVIENPFQISIDDALAATQSDFDLEEIKSSDNKNKWSIGPTISPVYYSSLTSGSSLDNDLANNSKSSETALSVGVKVNYQLTKKINLQSGVNRVELAYNTKGVTASFASSKSDLSHIKNSYSSVVLSSQNKKPYHDVQASAQFKANSLSGDLNQSIEYFEWPVEVKYNLYDHKFGVNLIGGFSTFFLSNNSISLNSASYHTNLGKATNLNSVNFSGNFGLDLDYKINNKWFLNVSPMFKYQFNTYSENPGNFQPYYLGVYSGLNYRF